MYTSTRRVCKGVYLAGDTLAAQGSALNPQSGPCCLEFLSPASVPLERPRFSYCGLLSSFSSFNPASVTLVPSRSMPTTGLPGRLASTSTRPPIFSSTFTAASSSARPGIARTSSPSSTPGPTAHRCRAMTTTAGYDGAELPQTQPRSLVPFLERGRAAPGAAVLLVTALATIVFLLGRFKISLAMEALLQLLLSQDFLGEHQPQGGTQVVRGEAERHFVGSFSEVQPRRTGAPEGLIDQFDQAHAGERAFAAHVQQFGKARPVSLAELEGPPQFRDLLETNIDVPEGLIPREFKVDHV